MSSVRYLILGVTFLVALIITLFVTLVWGIKLGLGEYEEEYVITFEQVQGLKEGDKVLVKGRQAGVVNAVEKKPGDPDRVYVTIKMLAGTFDDEADLGNYVFTVRNENLFGVKFIDVAPLEEIPAEHYASFVEAAADERGLQRALVLALPAVLAEPLGLDRDHALEFGGNLQGLLEHRPERDADGRWRLSFRMVSRLENPENYHYLVYPGGHLRRARVEVLTQKQHLYLERARGLRTGSEPNMGEVLEDLRAALLEFRTVGARINDPDAGALGKLVSDPAMAQKLDVIAADLQGGLADLRTVIADVKDATAKDGGGTLARVLHDEQLGQDVKDGVADLKDAIAELKRATGEQTGEGTVHTLLWDQKLASDVRAIGDNLQQVTAKLTQTRGSTLGMLINDDEIGRMLKSTMKNVNASVEDIREHAPVVTFTGVLFQAFQ